MTISAFNPNENEIEFFDTLEDAVDHIHQFDSEAIAFTGPLGDMTFQVYRAQADEVEINLERSVDDNFLPATYAAIPEYCEGLYDDASGFDHQLTHVHGGSLASLYGAPGRL